MLGGCGLLWVGAYFAYSRYQNREPQFHDNFRYSDEQTNMGGWQHFGGTWEILGGTMENISDDRGAKLMNGNPEWRNYTVEADIQLLSEGGDAGFVVRSHGEEAGVDAYYGYFAGIRDSDDTLIIGRSDFGWHAFRTVSVNSHVHTRTWYHLQLIVLGCNIGATVKTPEGELVVASVHDPDCIRSGRFGLQSYWTGAVWRNLDLRPATQTDWDSIVGNARPLKPDLTLVDRDNLPLTPPITDLNVHKMNFLPMLRQSVNNHAELNAIPITDLRLFAPNRSQRVTVHGVVTLVRPILFIQDSSGGIAGPSAHPVIPVEIGDQVEATGDAELHRFSSVLRNAEVRLLWSHSQVPPIAVTALQAASGGFDAGFVETEGRLTSIQRLSGNSTKLQLDEGSQSFFAIAENEGNFTAVSRLKVGSRLRLRGICVTDKSFTNDEVPFALLMRSRDDVQILAPPLWWNMQHVVTLAFALVSVLVGIQLLYFSFKRSRMRAVMEERELLAMEMHDTLAQSFAGLGFQLEALCDTARGDSPLRAQLESTLGLARLGHMQARQNISALRPANLVQLGLAAALEDVARSIVRGDRPVIDMVTRGEPRAIPLRISDTLFRIGQEAVANAVRHGRPELIRIRLSFDRDVVRLTVHDNGRGFCTRADSAGSGIRSMKQRAERIGATFGVHSTPGRGTILTVRVRSPRNVFSRLASLNFNLKKKLSKP
jgi:signal transduction histidine kinase